MAVKSLTDPPDITPPYNIRTEQALLGALLTSNKTLDRVVDFLQPEHFYDPLHGTIYGVIRERVASNRVADALSLRTMFEQSPDLQGGRGAGYLADLLVAMVGTITAAEYGRAIRDDWMRRELIEAAEGLRLRAAGYWPDEGLPLTVAQMMDEHDARLLRIAEGAGDETPLIGFGAAVGEQLADTLAASRRETPLAGLSSGYGAIDRMTLGLQAGKLVLLAARPSMGKTALGLGIAVRAAQSGVPVLMWSGEMAARQLAARAAAAYAGLSTTSVFSGRNWALPHDAQGRPVILRQCDWDVLVQAERAAASLPLQFDTRPAITPAQLRARARRMKRKGGLGLLVIDYVGLMRPSASNPRQSLYERVTEISRELMALKAELDIPVLALVQLNRANEAREDKVPQLADLRDSGALEQDADVVMMLHRPHYYLSRHEPQRKPNEADDSYHNRMASHTSQVAAEQGKATVFVPKNRQGPTGLTRLHFHDETTWFRDEGKADEPAWSGRMDV